MINNKSLEIYKNDPRWTDKNFRASCFLVESKIVPRYLYKFMKADDNLIDNLKNNQLWFSSPKDFNDPFDCKINATLDMSNEEIDCVVENLRKSAKKGEIEKSRMREAILNKPEEAKELLNEC